LDEHCQGVFTPEQRQFYEQNGYVVISKLIPMDHLEAYRERFVDLCDGRIDTRGLFTNQRDMLSVRFVARILTNDSPVHVHHAGCVDIGLEAQGRARCDQGSCFLRSFVCSC
jgi:hypothetical protein